MGGGCVECESKVSEELFEEHFSNLSLDISQEGWWEGGAKYKPFDGNFSALVYTFSKKGAEFEGLTIILSFLGSFACLIGWSCDMSML